MGDKPRKSGDMSDMAHRIKTIVGSTPIPREMISNSRVTVRAKTQTIAGYDGDGQPIYVDISSTDD